MVKLPGLKRSFTDIQLRILDSWMVPLLSSAGATAGITYSFPSLPKQYTLIEAIHASGRGVVTVNFNNTGNAGQYRMDLLADTGPLVANFTTPIILIGTPTAAHTFTFTRASAFAGNLTANIFLTRQHY